MLGDVQHLRAFARPAEPFVGIFVEPDQRILARVARDVPFLRGVANDLHPALAERRRGATGFRNERLVYPPVDNLWATRGAGGPVLCFAGHTDVVPSGPREDWRTDPFEPVVRDGLLYGRGAADMKSGLAAMLTATEAFILARRTFHGAIAFLITPRADGWTMLRTDTRVWATDPESRDRFARYWRVIAPGSLLIRHMWQRAIKVRAEATIR